MGIAHHSNYIVWFEIGRTDLCRAVGLTYREIEERGHLMVVTEVGCSYRRSYGYDQEVLIRTSLGRIASRAFRFDYGLFDETGEQRYASGFSSHMWVDRTSRKPIAVRGEILDRFNAWNEEPQ